MNCNSELLERGQRKAFIHSSSYPPAKSGPTDANSLLLLSCTGLGTDLVPMVLCQDSPAPGE